MQYVKVEKSSFYKMRLKHEMELALTTAVGKKFQQDIQRLKKCCSWSSVEHNGRSNLLPHVRVCEVKFDIVKYEAQERSTRSCKRL